MDYQVSARKYRPGTFQDVIGQPHIVQTLVNAITTGRIAHAYLFSGTRGVGKTTVARILAKALNCERGPTPTPCDVCANCQEIAQGSSVDVIEIDGASNTGVDDVREIRENVKFTPFRGHYRVYIIDEVHMLSTSAFNALLKTLEEPPAHVVFVFATTEIHKIPATILSRCQHYNFRRIPRSEITQRLRFVADQDGLRVEDRTLAAITRASEGSMRDALSLLDQAVAFCGTALRHEDVEMLLGAVPQEHVRDMVAAVRAQDSPAAVRVIARLLDQGHDLKAYCGELVERFRNLLVAAVVSDPRELRDLIDLSEEDVREIVAAAKAFSPEQLQELFRIFTQAEDALRSTSHPRFVLETAAVRATRLQVSAGSAQAAHLAPMAAPARRAGRDDPAAERTAGSQPATANPPAKPAESAGPAGKLAEPTPAPAGSGGPAQAAAARLKPGAASSQPSSPTSQPVAPARRPAPLRAQAVPEALSAAGGGEPADEAARPLALNWERLLERVEAVHPNIAPALAAGTLLSANSTQVVIGYPQTAPIALAKMRREESLRAVGEICAELAGCPVRVQVTELPDGQAANPSLAQVRAAKEQDQKRALLERARAHPLVKQALELFGGDLVEVRQVTPQKEAS